MHNLVYTGNSTNINLVLYVDSFCNEVYKQYDSSNLTITLVSIMNYNDCNIIIVLK